MAVEARAAGNGPEYEQAVVSGNQKATALQRLQAPAATAFLQALLKDIQSKSDPGIQSAEAVVNFFADCRPEDVQSRFYSVRRSLMSLTGEGDNEGLNQAVVGLYLLAATRLVNVAAGRIEDAALGRRVAMADLNLCAVIACSMMGGELQFKRAADGKSWLPSYVFHVQVPVAGGNERNAFLRGVYNLMLTEKLVRPYPESASDAGNSEDFMRKSREDAELSYQEAEDLASALDDLRHVQEVTLGLLGTGSVLDESAVRAISAVVPVPVFLHCPDTASNIVGMSQERLLAELQQLWGALQRASAKPSAPDIPQLLAQLSELAKAQGSQELTKAVADMQAALSKGAGADTDHLKRVAETAKNLATATQETGKTVEAVAKVAGVARQLYNVVAAMTGLPPLP